MGVKTSRIAARRNRLCASVGGALVLVIADAGAAIGQPFLGTTWQGVAYPSFGGFFTQLTPENDGKWGSVQPSPGTFNWSNLSPMYAVAAQRGMLIKQHNMIWAQQQPFWVNSANAATAEQNWFSAYAGKFSPNLIDVVNEPLDGPPGYASGLPDGGTSSSSYGGFGWVVQAYQLARTDFPNATLLINDYGILASAAKTAQYMNLIDVLKSKDLIDGIGLEAHGLENVSSATIQTNLNTLDTLDLPIYISEYDLNQSSDQAQLTQMETQFPIFYTNSMVQGITLWDFVAGHTWQPNANLLYANGNPRPAMQWLEKYMNPGGTVIDSGAIQTVSSSAALGTGMIALDFGGGTLRYGAAGVDIANALQLNDNGSYLDINGQAGARYSGNITGGGSLTIENTGNSNNNTLVMTGADNAFGTMTLDGNVRVMLDSAAGISGSGVIAGAISVNAGAVFGGTGTVSNTVTVAGTLAPGDGAAGTLNIQNLALLNSSKLDFILNAPNLGAGAGGNSFIVTTDVTLGAGVSIDITPGTAFDAGVYSLLSFSDAISNSADLSSWTVSGPAGFKYLLTDPAGMISLNVTAVPEPATLGLLTLVIGSFLLLARPRGVKNIA